MQTKDRAPRLVLRRALPPLQRLLSEPKAPSNPAFELTFISAGVTYKSLQRARNVRCATAEAMLELSYQCPDFDYQDARLISALQVQ